MELTSVLINNYLPYAKYTIVDRAIPSIDGFKPVQRRVIYTMSKLNLLGPSAKKAKCSKIVGATMAYHPHGDTSIYEGLVTVSKGHGGMTLPYIESKGNFGSVLDKSGAAAMRYTEAKLAPICEELFDGIRDGAVEMIPNFDGTEVEPVLLPTTFPNILVNTIAGVAVGTSSYIPPFALDNVVDATIGVLKGQIKNTTELLPVIGIPEYETGGYLHTDEASMLKLLDTGKGSFHFSGTVYTYPNKIEITEIPYNTTKDDIMEAVEAYAKSGELREVSDCRDDTGKDGFKVTIELKRGYNSKDVLAKLIRLTPLRTKISFRTRVIIDGRCKELGILELLNEWIKFRNITIANQYTNKVQKLSEKEHLLSVWEKVGSHIVEIVQNISKMKLEQSKKYIMDTFDVEEDQADYILDFRLAQLTPDLVAKSLNDLKKVRDDIAFSNSLVNDNNARKDYIIKQLEGVKKKYSQPHKTQKADIIDEKETKIEKAPISDESVQIVYTKNGYIKRLASIRSMYNFQIPDDDKEVLRFGAKNNEYLLVFTYDGTVHKVLVDSIDATGTKLTEQLFQRLSLQSKDDIMFIDGSGNFSGYFNIIYPNGRGARINYNRFSGPRQKYVHVFEECQKGGVFVTKENQFFIITKRFKAAYSSIDYIGKASSRAAYKVARIAKGDAIIGVLNGSKVSNIGDIELDKYNKEYTVCIGNDKIINDASDVKTGTLFEPADLFAKDIIQKEIDKQTENAEREAADLEAGRKLVEEMTNNLLGNEQSEVEENKEV